MICCAKKKPDTYHVEHDLHSGVGWLSPTNVLLEVFPGILQLTILLGKVQTQSLLDLLKKGSFKYKVCKYCNILSLLFYHYFITP